MKTLQSNFKTFGIFALILSLGACGDNAVSEDGQPPTSSYESTYETDNKNCSESFIFGYNSTTNSLVKFVDSYNSFLSKLEAFRANSENEVLLQNAMNALQEALSLGEKAKNACSTFQTSFTGENCLASVNGTNNFVSSHELETICADKVEVYRKLKELAGN